MDKYGKQTIRHWDAVNAQEDDQRAGDDRAQRRQFAAADVISTLAFFSGRFFHFLSEYL